MQNRTRIPEAILLAAALAYPLLLAAQAPGDAAPVPDAGTAPAPAGAETPAGEAAPPAEQGPAIYRSVGPDGTVIFSDQPSPGAERLERKDVQTVDTPPAPKFVYTPPAQPGQSPYTQVEIVSPGNDEAVRENAGDLTVSVAVKPALLGGDRLVIYLDGNPVAEGNSTRVDLENLDRGTHELRAEIQGPDGKVRKASAPVTFHLLRHSVLQPKPAPPGTPTNPPAPKPGGRSALPGTNPPKAGAD